MSSAAALSASSKSAGVIIFSPWSARQAQAVGQAALPASDRLGVDWQPSTQEPTKRARWSLVHSAAAGEARASRSAGPASQREGRAHEDEEAPPRQRVGEAARAVGELALEHLGDGRLVGHLGEAAPVLFALGGGEAVAE